MKTAFFVRHAIAWGLLLLCWGCATRYEAGIRGLEVTPSGSGKPLDQPAASAGAKTAQTRGAEPLSRSEVARAMAYEGRDQKSHVRQTAGQSPVSAISSSIKGGMDKVADIFTPESGLSSASDPTSLANASSPGPELYVAMARLSEQTGKVADAERQYEKALAMSPNSLDALVGFARLRDRQGKLEEAIQLYQRAAKANPRISSVHNDLGLCYARNRKYEEAIAEFARAVELEPNRKLYRNNLAAVLVETGDNDSAFNHLVAVHGEAAACYNLGYLVQKKGQIDLAKKLFAKAVERDPALSEARMWLEQLQRNPAAGQNRLPERATASRPQQPSASVVSSPVPNRFVPQAPQSSEAPPPQRPVFQARRQDNPPRAVHQVPATAFPVQMGPAEMAPMPPPVESGKPAIRAMPAAPMAPAPMRPVKILPPAPDAPLPPELPTTPTLYPLPPA